MSFYGKEIILELWCLNSFRLDCSPDGTGMFVSFESSPNAGFGKFVAVLEVAGNAKVT